MLFPGNFLTSTTVKILWSTACDWINDALSFQLHRISKCSENYEMWIDFSDGRSGVSPSEHRRQAQPTLWTRSMLLDHHAIPLRTSTSTCQTPPVRAPTPTYGFPAPQTTLAGTVTSAWAPMTLVVPWNRAMKVWIAAARRRSPEPQIDTTNYSSTPVFELDWRRRLSVVVHRFFWSYSVLPARC